MVPTTIENKPKTYTRPTLIARNSRPYIPRKEYVEQEKFKSISIQYLFDSNLNSSPSGYDLTSYDSISYETSPKSIYLNGSSYLSANITIDVKALGFWFKINTPTIDNYLISTGNDVFNIEINNTELNTTVNTKEQPISYDFLSYMWHHLLLNYSNQKYEIYINSNLAQETVDYTALTNNTLYLGKSLHDSTRILYGNIADLRLYNYSITDISTIYDEFFNNLPSTDFTIPFNDKTRGSTYMLSSVPNGTTELNIIINNILYNDVYEEGSGLYIDFTKTNLQNVIKVTITNFGTIYGRGGIGQTSSSSYDYYRREGKYAIKVLNNADNIHREIIIINNGNIYGGGDGGYYISSHTVKYEYRHIAFGEIETKWHSISINGNGGNAQYYDGNDVRSPQPPHLISGDIILDQRPDLGFLGGTYITNEYADIYLTNGGQSFNTSKIIDLPANNLVSVSYT